MSTKQLQVYQVNNDNGNNNNNQLRSDKRKRDLALDIVSVAGKDGLRVIAVTDLMDISSEDCPYASKLVKLPIANTVQDGEVYLLGGDIYDEWVSHLEDSITGDIMCGICEDLAGLTIYRRDIHVASKTVVTNHHQMFINNGSSSSSSNKKSKTMHNTLIHQQSQQMIVCTSLMQKEDHQSSLSSSSSSSMCGGGGNDTLTTRGGGGGGGVNTETINMFFQHMEKQRAENDKRCAEHREIARENQMENNTRFDRFLTLAENMQLSLDKANADHKAEIERKDEEIRRLQQLHKIEGPPSLIPSVTVVNPGPLIPGPTMISQVSGRFHISNLVSNERAQGIMEQQLIAIHRANKNSRFNGGSLYREDGNARIHVLHDGYYSLKTVLSLMYSRQDISNIYEIDIYLRRTSSVHDDGRDFVFVWYTEQKSRNWNEKVIKLNQLHQKMFHTISIVHPVFNFEDYMLLLERRSPSERFVKFTQQDARADIFPYPPETLTCLGTLKRTKIVYEPRRTGRLKSCHHCDSLCAFDLRKDKYVEHVHFQKNCFFEAPNIPTFDYEECIKDFDAQLLSVQRFVEQHQIIQKLKKEFGSLMAYSDNYIDYFFYSDGTNYSVGGGSTKGGNSSRSTTKSRYSDLEGRLTEYNAYIGQLRVGVLNEYMKKLDESINVASNLQFKQIIWFPPPHLPFNSTFHEPPSSFNQQNVGRANNVDENAEDDSRLEDEIDELGFNDVPNPPPSQPPQPLLLQVQPQQPPQARVQRFTFFEQDQYGNLIEDRSRENDPINTYNVLSQPQQPPQQPPVHVQRGTFFEQDQYGKLVEDHSRENDPINTYNISDELQRQADQLGDLNIGSPVEYQDSVESNVHLCFYNK